MRIEHDTKMSYEDWLKLAEQLNREGQVFGAYHTLRAAERIESVITYLKKEKNK